MTLGKSRLQEEALLAAVAADPSLIDQHPELAEVAAKARAAELKAQGNAAFAAGKHDEAAKLFTTCIELEPK